MYERLLLTVDVDYSVHLNNARNFFQTVLICIQAKPHSALSGAVAFGTAIEKSERLLKMKTSLTKLSTAATIFMRLRIKGRAVSTWALFLNQISRSHNNYIICSKFSSIEQISDIIKSKMSDSEVTDPNLEKMGADEIIDNVPVSSQASVSNSDAIVSCNSNDHRIDLWSPNPTPSANQTRTQNISAAAKDIIDDIVKMWKLGTTSTSKPGDGDNIKIINPENPKPVKTQEQSEQRTSLMELVPTKGSTCLQYSSLDFFEINALQSMSLESKSSSSGETNTTCTTVSDPDDDKFSTILDTTTLPTQAESHVHKMNPGQAGPPGQLTMSMRPGSYRVYRVQAVPRVEWEAIFFVEQNRAQARLCPFESWIFNIKLNRPDGSEQFLRLRPDPSLSHPRRHYFSFCPTETGAHYLSISVNVSTNPIDPDYRDINGSPITINPVRCYQDYCSPNILRIDVSLPLPLHFKVWGIAVHSPSNWIYLAGRDSHQIIILNEKAKIIHQFGQKGSRIGQLYRPTGIAVDSVHGRVIVSDKDNHRISVFDLDGNFIFTFGRNGFANGEFYYPWGVAVSPNGQIIAVTDSRNHRIQVFDMNGNFLRKFSIFETFPLKYKTEFDYPRGISFSLNGNHIYVTDFNLNSVNVFNLELTERKVFVEAGRLSRPQGITVDESNNLIIADSKNDCIRILSPNGRRIWTLNGNGKDKFNCPLDVAVLRGGRIAIVDKDNTLRIF